MGQEDLSALWREFKGTGSLTARNELILHYGSLVRYVATKVGAGLPGTVEYGDLVSYGTFGLIDAIEKFDLEKGVKFETYGIARIKGSIIDELRALDWVPRSIRSKARDVERVLQAMEAELGRVPEDHEVAARLGITLQELWALSGEVAVTSVSALDEGEGDDDRLSAGEQLSDVAADPEEIVRLKEMWGDVCEAVSRMPERSRVILVLYYLEEMTLSEIGQILGVTESRVCQLQSKLLQHLRESLHHGQVMVA